MLEAVHEADGHQVVVGDHGRGRLPEQVLDRGQAAGDGRRGGAEAARLQVQLQAGLPQRTPAHPIGPGRLGPPIPAQGR
jgi:hypothetical protein